MKDIQPDRISRKEGNRPEEPHLKSFQEDHYREKHQGQLSNIISLKWSTIIYIELIMSKQCPISYVIIPTR